MGLRSHYEKVICACCFLFLCVNVGFPSTSFNVYQPYIVELVGDTNGGLVLAVRTFVSLICMVFVARYYKRFDCRLGIFVATMCTAVGFLIYSFTSGFAFMCLAAAFTGAGYGLGGFSGMTLVIGRWFKKHVGTALGIATMGSGLASVVIPLVATHVIRNVSLAWAFRLEGLLALVIGLTVVALLRNRPDERYRSASVGGAVPAPAAAPAPAAPAAPAAAGGAAPAAPAAAGGAASAATAPAPAAPAATAPAAPAPRKATLSGSRLRLMQVAMFFLGCIAVDGYGYLSVLMTSSGFDYGFVAWMLSACGLALTIAKLANGAVFDALGTAKGSAIFFAIMNAGLALCCLAGLQSQPLMAAAIILVGIGETLGSVGISMWCIDLSAEEDRAKLVRDLQVAYATGGFLFNLVPGPFMDLVGTYTISYAILTAMGVACMGIVLSIYGSGASRRRGA